jgi:chaperone LolA
MIHRHRNNNPNNSPNLHRAAVQSALSKILVICTAIILLLAGSGSANRSLTVEDLKAVVTKLQDRYENLQDLEAEFSQTTEFAGFNTTMTSKGRLFLKKGKLRWDYLEPSKQQIFVVDDQVLFYVPEHQQVIKTRLSKQLDSQVPVRLLAGTGHLETDFNIRWKDESSPQDETGAYRMLLTPKSESPEFKQIQLNVDPKSYLILHIALEEPGGNRSRFEFTKTRINRGLKDQLFEFTVPKGVVVVEQP